MHATKPATRQAGRSAKGLPAAIVLALSAALTGAQAQTAHDWNADWTVAPDYELSMDASGFQFPSAIAFVPEPGPGPKDPLYFVTELRGSIKVVTNDRTVLTFADNVARTGPEEELPSEKGETGLAGIVLDPEHGYVFVSFAYADGDGALRNGLARYPTKPGTFDVRPTGEALSLSHLFEAFTTSVSHQIGPMVIRDGALFVSVGDAEQSENGQRLDTPGGKILRMTLDGQSLPDNPFYDESAPDSIRSYIWAYGLRNPFSLTAARDGIFLMDNGPNVDRFAELHKGWSYGYDGSDWSIGVSSQFVFSPAVAPTQLTFVGNNDDAYPPALRGHFLVALAGSPAWPPGPSVVGGKSIVHFGYDFENRRVTSTPTPLIMHRADKPQVLPAMAVKDGRVYFAPLLPFDDGPSAVFSLTYKPGHRHAYVIGEDISPLVLMAQKGCNSCHDPRMGAPVGPPLDATLAGRLKARLSSAEYREQVAGVDTLDDDLHVQYAEARREVLSKSGMDRVRAWMRYRLKEPTFDQKTSGMPNLGLTDNEIDALASYLLPDRTLLAQVMHVVRDPFYGFGLASFGGGLAIGALWTMVLFQLSRKRRAPKADA